VKRCGKKGVTVRLSNTPLERTGRPHRYRFYFLFLLVTAESMSILSEL
jgi:hypothetical protein